MNKFILDNDNAIINFEKQHNNDRNKRVEHQHFRPKILDIIFTMGKAQKKWLKEDETYSIAIKMSAVDLEISQKKRIDFESKQKIQEQNIDRLKCEITDREQKLKANIKELEVISQSYLNIPNFEEWIANDIQKELSAPWADDAWNDARARLFLEALKLHKAFIVVNAEIFRKNLHALIDILEGSVPQDAPHKGINAAWLTLFFVIPVVSTTFASFDRIFKHLGRENIGWLLIDEAGQATPQSAIGGIWRSKKVVVVGDPLQLEPVITLPLTAQQSLRQQANFSERWVPTWTSLQMLADRVTPVGTFLTYNDYPLWVGSPLRVNRRCDNPMFKISNQIAYDQLMVFGISTRPSLDLPDSCWLHVNSHNADGHFIPEEAERLKILLQSLIFIGCNPADIFLISHFKQVVNELRSFKNLYNDLKIGTIHTTQGKEADVVILVLGGNPKKPGAKKWAAKNPNLLNVAVSRAKRRLYVIGDRDNWQKFNYFEYMAQSLTIG